MGLDAPPVGYVALLVDRFTPRGQTTIGDDVFPVDPQDARMPDAYAAKAYLAPQPFVASRRNRHFFATVECITAPFLVIFVTNRQSQVRKGKFERVATFPVRSDLSYSGTGPNSDDEPALRRSPPGKRFFCELHPERRNPQYNREEKLNCTFGKNQSPVPP
jgi:hypothetical protein